MRRSIVRLIVLIVALGLLISGMAFADPDPAPPSNSADISGGIFKEANDKFLSPTDFSDLESHVVFLQFDMPSGALPGQGFEIGGSADLAGMYVGAYLNSIIEGTNGTLGGGDSMTTDVNKVFLLDGGGLITGSTESRTVEIEYDVDSMNDFQALVGIGTMGIGLQVYQSAANVRGTLDPSGTFPGGLVWNDIGVGGSSSANTFSTYDAVGALVAVNSDGFGLGTDNNQQIDVTATFGMPLPISDSMELEIGGDLLFGLRNDDATASQEQFTRVVGSGTAIAYLPGQTLDGSDPVAIDDLTSYSWLNAMESNSHMMLAPSVFANVMMPLKEAMTAFGGIDLGVSLPLYSAKYNDNLGAEQKVSGLADSYYSVDVVSELNPTDPTLTQTTTVTTRGWETQDMSSMTVDLDLSAGVEVVPNERFRFGVLYTPTVSFTSASTTFAGEAVEVTVLDNGDGADGVGDQVDEITVARNGYTTSDKSITVTNRVNTAAQFFLIPERLRVNLGAQVDNVMIDRMVSEVVINGLAERTTRQAVDTTDTAATTFVVTDYDFEPDDTTLDDSQTVEQAGSSSLIYDAGLTFFFDESMFLDLRMDATGGDIWSTNEWSLEMTILY